MSLISCPECNHQVSDRASACPSCGHPVRRHQVAEMAVDEWGRAVGLFSTAWEKPRIRLGLMVAALIAFLMFLAD